jgi:hypothetical protein
MSTLLWTGSQLSAPNTVFFLFYTTPSDFNISLPWLEIWNQPFTAAVASFLAILYIWSHYSQGGGNSRIGTIYNNHIQWKR